MSPNSRIVDERSAVLFQAILTLGSVDECHRFFEDLCTVSEIESLSSRFELARMIDSGLTYTDISQKTGASSATISRVKRFLHYGADGYRLVLDRMKDRGLLCPDSSRPAPNSHTTS
ncbi:MAG: YerC/YecD family TrpR-related protein [Clostridia bacterium]|nr:YerC/YecD family TrpR-related protein [Clostridia bacterium]